jgi:ABC-2 type transport system permease protein
MNKYLSVFKISFQQEFVYRINFIMWRVRNVLQFFLIFFLWDTVFADPKRFVFGYDRAKILTYVFGLLIVRSFVLSTRGVDVTGEVADGRLSNYLLKPVSFFRYWLVRDISSKSLNLIFAAGEAIMLFLLLKPPFFLQGNVFLLLGFLVSISLAMFIYFTLILMTGAIPLWVPEAAWGGSFLVTAIFAEFLTGALFPLDILPASILNILKLTPFPYLIFFPIQIYLGKMTSVEMIQGIIVSGIWALILWYILTVVWRRGLRAYESHGR